MQAKLAIDQINSRFGFCVVVKDTMESFGEKNSIRINFDCPIVEAKSSVTYDLVPYIDEDLQTCPIASKVTSEVRMDNANMEPRSYFDVHVTVDSVLLAGENACIVPVLQSYQVLLVTYWLDKGKAKE